MSQRSYILDLTRWIAALLVVSGHIRSFLFEDYRSQNANLLGKVFYFITGFGHQAVIIFFVLSGYLIGKTVINQYKNGAFVLNKYLVSRITRIYIVLIPALLFTYLIDKAGIFIDKDGIYKTYNQIISLQVNPSSRLGFNYFICSLFMLQNIWLPVFGSNEPLWSLSPEFTYYLLIPLFAYIPFVKKYLFKVIAILLAIAFFFILPSYILKYFLIWICGLIPYFIHIKKILLSYLVIFAFIGSFVFSRVYNMDEMDFINAISFSLLIAIANDKKLLNMRFNFSKKLASFSYSLYLIHFPLGLFIIVFSNRFLTPSIKINLNFYSLLIYFAILIIVYIISYLFARITEYHTEFIRKNFMNLIH